MKIIVSYIKKSEELDKINLSYSHNGTTFSREIKLNSSRILDYTTDNKSPAFDFLILSIAIYNIDTLISRYLHSYDGWTRELEVTVCLNNNELFNKNKKKLEETISFLTGDIWKFNFNPILESLSIFPIKKKKNQITTQILNEITKVSLFSGGLDSLIGVLDLLNSNENILLCSHYVKFEDNEQKAIRSIFTKEKYNNFDHIQVMTQLESKSTQQIYEDGETTFRSRSLLFLSIAVYLANNISEICEIIMPENGTISLNMPLSKSRRGSCSTRTTHPTMIMMLEEVLMGIGIKNRISNPFEFKTKGELVKEFYDKNIIDSKLLKELINKSVSCGKRGHRRNWDAHKRNKNVKHCGVCMPCIYRRASLNMIDEDFEKDYGRDIFTSDKFFINDIGKDSADDFRALLHFLNRNYSIEEIEKELVIGGINNFNKLQDYSQVVDRTIKQVKEWIEKNGSKEVKKYILKNKLENLK